MAGRTIAWGGWLTGDLGPMARRSVASDLGGSWTPMRRRACDVECKARVTDTAGDAGLAGLLAELEWRGMLHATTPGLPARLATGRPIAAYNGFDPSGRWLHIGHLVPIFGLIQLQRAGGRPIALVGGGTGHDRRPVGAVVGAEPARRRDARARTSPRSARSSSGSSTSRRAPTRRVMVNNLDWLGELSLIEFLRDIGKHFTIPYMLAKDSVQVAARAGPVVHRVQLHAAPGADFAAPVPDEGVELQMGGADQWGNITAGLELIRRTSRRRTAATESTRPTASPTRCSCRRRARSSARARRASRSGSTPTRTSPYAFYQYWLNTDDRDVGTYLRWFTLLDASGSRRSRRGRGRPEAREAQRALALRHHRARPRRDGGGPRGARVARRPSPASRWSTRRCSRRSIAAVDGFTFTAEQAAGAVPLLVDVGDVRLERRGAAHDRRRRRDGQRGARRPPRTRGAGADRTASGWSCASASGRCGWAAWRSSARSRRAARP